MKKQENRGFALIALIIVLAIIAIWASVYFVRSKEKPNVIQTGNRAIEQTKQNNTLLNTRQAETQNNLNNFPNKIDAIYNVGLSDLEKDQVVKSVDAFMNEFKLPRGDFQNSYTLLVERRLNDALKVVTDPEQAENDAHAIIYLRKVDGVWQVDKSAGPWCTLEEFEQLNCQ